MGETSDIFARAKKQQAERAGAASAKPAAQAKPATKPKPDKPAAPVNSAPAQAAQPAVDAAPWGNPSCPACKGFGINSKGHACPICDKTAAARGVPSSSNYTLDVGEDGMVTAVALDEEMIEGLGFATAWAGMIPKKGGPAASAAARTAAAPASMPKAAPVESMPPKKEPADEKPEEVAEEVDQVVSDIKAVAKAGATPKGRRRPKAGVVVLIGAMQLKGPDRPTVTAQELLETVGAELAKDMGVASYWELDAFKRRERIRQQGAAVAESLGRSIVVVAGGTNDPDVMSLIGAIVPHAEWVIEGLR